MKGRKIGLILSAMLVMQSVSVFATEIQEKPLFKYGTTDPILLHGEQITVPTEFKNTKEDFRATWVSTVSNIDFPKIQNENEFREQFTTVVEKSKELGLNALIFQVRPMLDAWYKSKINPSSEFISGKQGAELSFDPLEIAVEIAHANGLELHAWFNPYRVTNSTRDYRTKEEKLNSLAENNFARNNPDLVFEFANKLFLDPGRPEVLDHIEDTIQEVVENYDVDAIHFDDYFYPYKTSFKKVLGYDENGQPILDEKTTTMAMRDSDADFATFEEFGGEFDDIHKWRMDNINSLVDRVEKTIDEYNNQSNDSVQFGISPFGIWGHNEEIEGGSHTPTTSTASINDYVDTKKWAQEEKVDYLIPQIYWQFNQPAAPYGELVDWWNEQFEGVEKSQLYIGHPNYKIIENSATDFENVDEIPSQLRFNQKHNNVKGSAFFSYNKLDGRYHAKDLSSDDIDYRFDVDQTSMQSKIAGRDEVNKATTQTIKEYYKTFANVPAKPWLDKLDTVAVNGLNAKNKNGVNTLRWNDKNEDSKFYQIYRVEGRVKEISKDDTESIIARFGKSQGQEFIDDDIDSQKTYTYGVTIIDNSGKESEMNVFTVNGKK